MRCAPSPANGGSCDLGDLISLTGPTTITGGANFGDYDLCVRYSPMDSWSIQTASFVLAPVTGNVLFSLVSLPVIVSPGGTYAVIVNGPPLSYPEAQVCCRVPPSLPFFGLG